MKTLKQIETELDKIEIQQSFTKKVGSETFKVNIRFNDDYNNGHNSFAITMDTLNEGGRMVAGGCQHDEIEKHFPELKKLIKWHFMNSDGPMHYIANTVYWAKEEKNLRFARETAIWPKANLSQLSNKTLLNNRLPKLMNRFYSVIKSLNGAK